MEVIGVVTATIDWSAAEEMSKRFLTQRGIDRHLRFCQIDVRVGRLFLAGMMLAAMIRRGDLPKPGMVIAAWTMKDAVKRLKLSSSDLDTVRDLCREVESILDGVLQFVTEHMRIIDPAKVN